MTRAPTPTTPPHRWRSTRTALDTEGIVRSHDGTFWLVDEYGPSLVHVSARGRVLTRYVPKGLEPEGRRLPGGRGPAVGVPAPARATGASRASPSFRAETWSSPCRARCSTPPSRSGKRRGPRVCCASRRTGARSRPSTPTPSTRSAPSTPARTTPTELKISSVVAAGPDTLLVQERTDRAARLHRVVLRPGKTSWAPPGTRPPPRRWRRCRTRRPRACRCCRRSSSSTSTRCPARRRRSRASPSSTRGPSRVINDNDFGMTDGAGAFDPDGRLVDSGMETTLVQIRLDARLR